MNRKKTLHKIVAEYLVRTPLATYTDGRKNGTKYKMVFDANIVFLPDGLIQAALDEICRQPEVTSAKFRKLEQTYNWCGCYAIDVWFATKASTSKPKEKVMATTPNHKTLIVSDILCCNPELVKALATSALECMMVAAIDDPDMLEANTPLKLRESAREYVRDMLHDLEKEVRLEINKTPVEFEVVHKVNKSTVNGKLITG